MPKRPYSNLKKLFIVEVLFTILPAILFPLAFLVLGKLFAPLALIVLLLSFIYLLPAFILANGLGYHTIHGNPPVPLPASTLSGLLILILTHAALVAIILFYCRGIVAAERLLYQKLGFRPTSDHGLLADRSAKEQSALSRRFLRLK